MKKKIIVNLICIVFLIIGTLSISFYYKNIELKALEYILYGDFRETFIVDDHGIWLYGVEGVIPNDNSIEYMEKTGKDFIKYEDALLLAETNNTSIYTIIRTELINYDVAEVLTPQKIESIKDYRDLIKKDKFLYVIQVENIKYYKDYWERNKGKAINLENALLIDWISLNMIPAFSLLLLNVINLRILLMKNKRVSKNDAIRTIVIFVLIPISLYIFK